MEDFPVFSPLIVNSHKGKYQASFHEEINFSETDNLKQLHFIIDRKVADLYKKQLEKIL